MPLNYASAGDKSEVSINRSSSTGCSVQRLCGDAESALDDYMHLLLDEAAGDYLTLMRPRERLQHALCAAFETQSTSLADIRSKMHLTQLLKVCLPRDDVRVTFAVSCLVDDLIEFAEG